LPKNNNNVIRKIVISTADVTTYIGTQGVNRVVNNSYYPGSLFWPDAICFDSTLSNLYITDKANFRIKKLDISSGLLSTIAGSGISGNTEGIGSNASFCNIRGICIDPSDNNLYMTDWLSYKIRRITLSNNNVITFAGNGNSGSTDGIGSNAAIGQPIGICIDPQGSNLYFCDNKNNRIKKVTVSTAQVTTIAGNNTIATTDGLGTAASFTGPHGICFDTVNNALYVLQFTDGCIRYISSSSNVSSLTGSTGTYKDGTGTQAGFFQPYSITMPANSTKLLISDNNNCVRLMQNVSTPITGSVTLPTPVSSAEPSYVIKYNSTGLPT
jgi:sugar lactone lactonase YvrE